MSLSLTNMTLSYSPLTAEEEEEEEANEGHIIRMRPTCTAGQLLLSWQLPPETEG